jgi:hypothetical protein
LYIRSLGVYANREVTGAVVMLNGGGPPGDSIGSLLGTVVDRIVKHNDRLGSLFCNSAMDTGTSDAEIASLVRQCFNPLQQVFSEPLRSNGHNEPESQAHQLLALYTGLQVMSRAGTPR